VSDSAVRIVGDDGGGPEEPNDAYKLPRWTRVFVPAAIAAVVVAAFFLAMSNPPWRPTASGVVVDVYLEIGTPETAEQMLNQVGTHASVVDRRLLRQPPRLQGWLTPSACDYRPIVRLMVPTMAEAAVLRDFIAETYPPGPDSEIAYFISTEHGDIHNSLTQWCDQRTDTKLSDR